MKELAERFSIVGRSVPFRLDNPVVALGEIGIDDSGLEVVLASRSFGSLTCRCEIWEHTVYELEILSSSLRKAAEGEFPPNVEVARPAGYISEKCTLQLAVSIEVGYSLQTPSANRANFFCHSRDWGLRRERVLGVLIGLALSGAYEEVVMEPAHALELADWLDLHLAEICA